jgi:hypothetical protein
MDKTNEIIELANKRCEDELWKDWKGGLSVLFFLYIAFYWEAIKIKEVEIND